MARGSAAPAAVIGSALSVKIGKRPLAEKYFDRSLLGH